MTDQPTELEQRIALVLCQFRRVTRDMPSALEINQAIPTARRIIKEITNHKDTV